jgi:hypothetical protein
VVEDGWTLARAAERHQAGTGRACGMTDRSSRPKRTPSRLERHTERRIIALRFTHRWGPHRIGYRLDMHPSQVWQVLARYRMPLLAPSDQATGLPARRPRPTRYEKNSPGELVHVDIKKLGRVPDGGGLRMYGRGSTQNRRAGSSRDRAARAGAAASRGSRHLHHAIDDYSRLAYSEILAEERKESRAGSGYGPARSSLMPTSPWPPS